MLGKKPTRHSMDLFLEAKHAFRSEFEALRNILQSISRHSHYFETSCQRAPDDRYMSANRCQLSAKALLRDLQTGNEEYEKVLLSFKDQQISLFDLLNAKGQKIGSSFFVWLVFLKVDYHLHSSPKFRVCGYGIGHRCQEPRCCFIRCLGRYSILPRRCSLILGHPRCLLETPRQPPEQFSPSWRRDKGDGRIMGLVSECHSPLK